MEVVNNNSIQIKYPSGILESFPYGSIVGISSYAKGSDFYIVMLIDSESMNSKVIKISDITNQPEWTNTRDGVNKAIDDINGFINNSSPVLTPVITDVMGEKNGAFVVIGITGNNILRTTKVLVNEEEFEAEFFEEDHSPTPYLLVSIEEVELIATPLRNIQLFNDNVGSNIYEYTYVP